ncbi:MAG: 50S ribosomal protein L13 [Candidatus Woykebacteria bacterium RIFCSPHIGHO2_12_FULL_45_10]|uniref:Large ribosomal subunit protein uL13 n=1 Tax=Candidatus Woykebacteria bacterium RIFCSPHIGHO2_12_FULL_45_10 TaxID=1802603 RepID=A0A1G1WN33_9BACT|nr:MAG: 50S ribosomal protein L13 [Candidatus Woykebacteria bacterium RIFCSPHIGHO2_12_FULL_45_10]
METQKKQKSKNLTKEKLVRPKVKPERAIKWYLLDAKDKILGKVAVKAAKVLLAKAVPTKKSFEAPVDRVVVINASKVAVTGRKEEEKKYYRYSGYPGGLKERTLGQVRASKPEEIVSHAVFGMLPKNRLGRKIQKHLYIYPGTTHPHEAQKLESVEVK